MSLTLEDLNFEFDSSAIDPIEDDIQNGIITPETNIVETPDKINDFLLKLVDQLKVLFNQNLENIAGDFDSWYDQKAEDLKNDIKNSLALDSNTLYDIYVKRAQKADDSDKFNDKTYSEMISDLYTNYITTATVKNSINFNGKTMDDYNTYIKTDLKPLASDTEKAFGYNYDELKSSILNDAATTDSGASMDDVKANVENSWTAYKANDTIKFNGATSDSWKTDIIPNIKINEAITADKLSGYTYDDITNLINNKISSNNDSVINKDNSNLIDIIKNTKVNNSFQSDEAINATKFDNKTYSDWIDTVIPGIKVDNATYADNSAKLGGIAAEAWQTKIDDIEPDVKNKVETEWTSYQANTVLKINDTNTVDYDDHINDLIDAKLGDVNTLDINAKKFDDKTSDDWVEVIKTTLVDNANHATSADTATLSSDSEKAKVWYDDVNEFTPFSYLDYIKGNLDSILINYNYSSKLSENKNQVDSFLSNFFTYNKFNLIGDKQIFIKYDNDFKDFPFNQYTNNFFNQESFSKNYTKKEYTYDDNGNLAEIDYYVNYLKYDEDDLTKDPTTESLKIKIEEFEYDDNGSITKVTETFISNYYMEDETDLIINNIESDDSWLNIQLIKIDDLTYDDNGNLTEEDISYKLKYKKFSDDDYTEVDLI